jgi:hypothetical protein
MFKVACGAAVVLAASSPLVGSNLSLSDPVAYAAAYPACNLLNGDCDFDGDVDFDDINAFVALLSG